MVQVSALSDSDSLSRELWTCHLKLDALRSRSKPDQVFSLTANVRPGPTHTGGRSEREQCEPLGTAYRSTVRMTRRMRQLRHVSAFFVRVYFLFS
jgi:hypothetical protein